jgi:hypothetical protein
MSLINTDGQPLQNTPISGNPLVVGGGSSTGGSTITSGANNLYPVYESAGNTDGKYNDDCKSWALPKLISSNIDFTISGSYTVSGTTITTSSNCTVTIKFTSGILISNISTGPFTTTETIIIPSGRTISSDLGTSISSLKTLKDSSTSKLTMNIIVTITNAKSVSNTLNADIKIEFKRNYNHLTSTTTTPTVAGYTNYAPGQFSTNLTSLIGKISGATEKFNSAITFTIAPSFTHIVYPSD